MAGDAGRGRGDEGKDAIRELVWDALQDEGAAAFPFPPHGRIPNFKGAADAARGLAATDAWNAADVLKCNPDAPQRHVRKRALEDGKTVYMAVPRLKQAACFLELDPWRVDAGDASSIQGAFEHGEEVSPGDLPRIGLVVTGSVAVDRDGHRVGKGGGYSDLEYALARQMGAIDPQTQVATTVHPLQVREGLPRAPHDIAVDLFATPDDVIAVEPRPDQPSGIDWDALSDRQVGDMPPLAQLTASR